MKKIIFGAAAALFMMSACEVIEPVDPNTENQISVDITMGADQNSSDPIIFTASLAPQSKTYLDYDGYGYKTKWDEYDQILLWNASELENDNPTYEFSEIVKGAGTTNAEFIVKMQADSYFALYAQNYSYPAFGTPIIYLPTNQQMRRLDDESNISLGAYPMAAISDGNHLEFHNLCSILKVSVTGNGENLDCIRVSAPNGESISGHMFVVPSDGTFEMISAVDYGAEGYPWVDFYTHEGDLRLSRTPVDCYIVVPAQNYSGGLKFTVYTSKGLMEVSTDSAVTTSASRFYDVAIEYETEVESISYMLGSYTMYAESYFAGEISWTMEINESHDDTRTLWFCNLCDGLILQETRFYGILSQDGRTITIPFPQETEYIFDNGYPATLYGFDGQEVFTSGALVVEVYDDQQSMILDFGEEMGMGFFVDGEDGGWCDVLYPGIYAVKD